MEITAFLDRELARPSRTYDSDGDGFIEREDFAQAGLRTIKAFELAGDAPRAVGFQPLPIGLRERLSSVAGQDRRSRISIDEDKKAFTNGLLETTESGNWLLGSLD